MPKTDFTQYDKLPGNNTDVDGIDIAEGCAPSGINNAIRSVMSHIAELNDGTVAMTSPSAASLTITSADINGGTIAGVNIDGNITASANISFGDNNKAIFGAGSDFEIYHNGSNNYIDSTSRDLYIDAYDFIRFRDSVSNGTMAQLNSSGSVDLYYNNFKKLETVQTGVTITGTAYVESPVGPIVQLVNTDTTISPADIVGAIEFKTSDLDEDGTDVQAAIKAIALDSSPDTRLSFYTLENVVSQDDSATERLRINNNGDISFLDSTGVSQDLFWDASTSRLGINNTAPATALDVTGTVTADGLTVDGSLQFVDSLSTARNVLQLSSDDVLLQTGTTAGARSVIVKTEGLERFRVNYDGNIGIGTTAPSDTLHIESSTTSTGLRLHNTGTGGGEFRLLATSNAASIGGGNLAIYDQDSAAYRFVLDSSGNVGIGTSTPSANLDVASSNASIHLTDTDDTTYAQIRNNGGTFTIASDEGNAATNSSINFRVDAAERMRLDSSGRLGIGTTAPATYGVDNAEDLVIGQGDGNHGITISSFNTSNGTIAFSDTTNATVGRGFVDYDHNVDAMSFGTLSAERMRIDSSGNLLVGTTSTSIDTSSGSYLSNSGFIMTSRDGSVSAFFNRFTSDGAVVAIRKSGTTTGYINTVGGDIAVGTSDTGLRFYDVSNQILPHNMNTNVSRDALISLGAGGARFKDLYLSGGAYLGGTGAANKLDDYEEGTWTPTTAGDATGALSASSAGQYTKVGRMVTVQCQLQVTTNFTNQVIGGLPFQPRIQSSLSSVYGVFPVGTSSGAAVFVVMNDTDTNMRFYSSPVWSSHVPNTTRNVYRFAFVYETDA